MEKFWGFHSEWNLGSPGGWDYQRTSQEISARVWERINKISPTGVELDFGHPYMCPVDGLVEMLVGAHRAREGSNPGRILVVAEEETLEDVTENRNLAMRLDSIDGISGALAAPHWLELKDSRVFHQGEPVSVIFMDFNTDVLLALHRKHDLSPLLQAVREGRVINPRGTEPINVKSMFEVITGPLRDRFHPEIVSRTPWTRQFHERSTTGPSGEEIPDLIEWTRKNWDNLVLKPERGYSGKGVRVGGVNPEVEEAIEAALKAGDYILQEKVPLNMWAERVPDLDHDSGLVVMKDFQTDFRCFVGPAGMIGCLGRIGGVPTNVGSGGGMQPLALLRGGGDPREAVQRINRVIESMSYADLSEIEAMQKELALAEKFTYLLGPIKIALRPRVLTEGHLKALEQYSRDMWSDCLVLEKMWKAGELDQFIKIEPEELDIARSQPWQGSAAIIASDGLFSFGAHPEG